MMFAIISSVLLFTMTTMPLFWFYFKANYGWYTVKGKGCSAFCAVVITPKTSTTNTTHST